MLLFLSAPTALNSAFANIDGLLERQTPGTTQDWRSGSRLVRIRPITGEPIIADLAAVSKDGGVEYRDAGGASGALPLADCVTIEFSPEEPRPAPGWRVDIQGGGRLYGWPSEISANEITLDCADFGVIKLPLEWVSGIIPSPKQPTSSGVRAAEAFLDETATSDAVLLSNEDVLEGFIVDLAPDRVSLEVADHARQIERDLVLALRFAPVLSPGSKSRPAARLISLRSGELLLDSCESKGRAIEGRLLTGQTLRAEFANLQRLEILNGRWRWLTDLEPVSSAQTPMMSLSWPMRVNRNTLGGPLSVAGRIFEHGLGLHARCELQYELKGEYEALICQFGLDDASGPWGHVTVTILVDGAVRYQNDDVVEGVLHGPLRVPLRGQGEPPAQKLKLVVDFGKNGDIQDRFDWIEPALIRRASDGPAKGQ